VPNKFTNALSKSIFWEYPRGSKQYDLIVILILAFIFLTPREWFRDQPRVLSASTIAVLPDGGGYLIDPEMLNGVPEADRLSKVSGILSSRTTKPILRVQPIYDESEHELKGYVAYTNP
jgi:hypothetical protein